MERILTLSNVSPLMHWNFTGACIISKVSSCACEENWEPWWRLRPCPFLLLLCVFSLLGKNTKAIGRHHLPSTPFPETSASWDVPVWVHPQPVSKPGGLTLRSSIVGLLIICYFEAESDEEPLPPAHLDSAKSGCPELKLPYSGDSWYQSVWFLCQKYVCEDELCSINFFVFQM